MTPGVMRFFPLGVNNGRLAYFHDAIARAEAHCRRGFHQFHVGPLIPMIVNVVGDLTKQNAAISENSVRFADERWVQVRETMAIPGERLQYQAEARIEILCLVFSLIRDVWRIVNNYVKASVLEGHPPVIGNDVRTETGVDVDAKNFSATSLPESSSIERRIKNRSGAPIRIELKHFFEQFTIRAVPNRGNRLIS